MTPLQAACAGIVSHLQARLARDHGLTDAMPEHFRNALTTGLQGAAGQCVSRGRLDEGVLDSLWPALEESLGKCSLPAERNARVMRLVQEVVRAGLAGVVPVLSINAAAGNQSKEP